MPFVNFQIEITKENSSVIEKINALLLAEPETGASTKPASTTKPKAEKTEKTEKAEKTEETISLAQFKEAIKSAKADHDEDFCKSVLAEYGADDTKPLGRMASSIDSDDYADAIEALEAGPGGPVSSGDDDDDGLGDDDEDEVDAEAVKLAAKAYAKEVGRAEAKEIMTRHGAPTLIKIGECTDKQLQAMFKEFTA